MARKKITPKKQKVSPKEVKKAPVVHPLSYPLQWVESYTSLLMGIVVVIVVVLFAVSLIRSAHHLQDTSSIKIGPSAIPTQTVLTPTPAVEKTYTVQAGDDLWSIAEKLFKSGYNWVDLARANNISDPGVIYAGTKLVIPTITPAPSTVPAQSELGQITQKMQPESIIGKTYTVQAGDDLWSIAVRAYADGYKWGDIARINNLADPSVIHSGNVLIIPR
ncbi:MAG TPA: LysM domain-containing protein [Patescibacteria group bacterium]|nr:LysM domain-containing protein [Patescibacteria group bacterium]